MNYNIPKTPHRLQVPDLFLCHNQANNKQYKEGTSSEAPSFAPKKIHPIQSVYSAALKTPRNSEHHRLSEVVAAPSKQMHEYRIPTSVTPSPVNRTRAAVSTTSTTTNKNVCEIRTLRAPPSPHNNSKRSRSKGISLVSHTDSDRPEEKINQQFASFAQHRLPVPLVGIRLDRETGEVYQLLRDTQHNNRYAGHTPQGNRSQKGTISSINQTIAKAINNNNNINQTSTVLSNYGGRERAISNNTEGIFHVNGQKMKMMSPTTYATLFGSPQTPKDHPTAPSRPPSNLYNNSFLPTATTITAVSAFNIQQPIKSSEDARFYTKKTLIQNNHKMHSPHNIGRPPSHSIIITRDNNKQAHMMMSDGMQHDLSNAGSSSSIKKNINSIPMIDKPVLHNSPIFTPLQSQNYHNSEKAMTEKDQHYKAGYSRIATQQEQPALPSSATNLRSTSIKSPLSNNNTTYNQSGSTFFSKSFFEPKSQADLASLGDRKKLIHLKRNHQVESQLFLRPSLSVLEKSQDIKFYPSLFQNNSTISVNINPVVRAESSKPLHKDILENSKISQNFFGQGKNILQNSSNSKFSKIKINLDGDPQPQPPLFVTVKPATQLKTQQSSSNDEPGTNSRQIEIDMVQRSPRKNIMTLSTVRSQEHLVSDELEDDQPLENIRYTKDHQINYTLTPPKMHQQQPYSLQLLNPLYRSVVSNIKSSTPDIRIEESLIQTKSILENFHIIFKLAQGQYKKQFVCLQKSVGLLVNTKHVIREMTQQVSNELTIYGSLLSRSGYQHPNILSIHQTAMDGDCFVLIREYYDCTLADRHVTLPKGELLKAAKDVLHALMYLHELDVSHNRLGSDCVVEVCGVYKLCNFEQSVQGASVSDKRRDLYRLGECLMRMWGVELEQLQLEDEEGERGLIKKLLFSPQLDIRELLMCY